MAAQNTFVTANSSKIRRVGETLLPSRSTKFVSSRAKVLFVVVCLMLALSSSGCGAAGSSSAVGNPPHPAPDFSLGVTPSTQTMAPNGAATFNVDITFLNGFTSTSVAFLITGLPAGVSGVFSPNPLPHEGRSVLTLTGNGNAVPGNHALRVTASAQGLTHSSDITLTISLNPDFSISASPTTQDMAAGGSTSYQVTLGSMNGFANPVTLSVSGLPTGSSGSFSPNPAAAPTIATFVVATTTTTPQGQFTLTVSGTSGSLVHTVQVVLVVVAPGAAWRISVVGSTGAQNNSVRVGPAHNDGVNRLYVGTVTTGRVLEFSWSGSQWGTPADIGGSPTGGEIHNMGMGPGRNDNVTRIYAASADGNLWELSFVGPGWAQAAVGTPGSFCTHAAVGSGRNDGVNRVYATKDANVWEYTWNGAGWNHVLVGSVASGLAHGISIGNGRGDGLNHLYVASSASGTYEATFSAGTWSLVSMGDSGDIVNVSPGAGRNDGVMRVYAALRATGQIREFTWGGSSWTFSQINSPLSIELIHAYVFAGRNDGVMRVYSSGSDGNAYEFYWTGASWTINVLGGGSGYMYGSHYGQGRNDGLLRLYGASFNTQLFEYTWSATP